MKTHVDPASLFVALERARERVQTQVAALLKGAGLTSPQYNVLRILRGAGPGGLSCQEIAARLIRRDPDVTRLIDRLAASGMVSRGRGAEDRRVIRVKLERKGQDRLAALDEPIRELHERQFAPLGREERNSLHHCLERVGIG